MPINKKDLKKIKWPLPSFAIGQEVDRRKEKESGIIFYDDNATEVIAKEGKNYASLPYPDDYLKSCYVREGKVMAIPLPIPPGECGITSLVKGTDGNIFGATSGERCHLFVCNPKKEAVDSIVDLGKIDVNSEKSSLVVFGDGRLFLGTKPVSGNGYIYSYDIKNSSSKIEKICCPVKGEGISALAIDNNVSRIYGLSSITGTFFIFHLESSSIKLKGPVDKDNLFSEVLVLTSDGDVFGGARWGKIFKYDVKRDQLITLAIEAPSISGRRMYNKIDSLIFDKRSQSIYGGTSGDGILFRFTPQEEKMISLGKPLNQPRIRCLAVGTDSCIYGIAGKSCCHLFRYNPEQGDLRDLGILYVTTPRSWHGYEFDVAITGKYCKIYFGENDRISHLFTYCPQVEELN